MTFTNATDPRKPPMTYTEIRAHIESVLDANDVPTVTPKVGLLLAEAEKTLAVDEGDPKFIRGDRGGRGRGQRGRGGRGGGAGGGGNGRGGGNDRGGDRSDRRVDKPGHFPGDLTLMKTKAGAPICVAYQKGRCDKKVDNGGCSTNNGIRLHCCAVIVSMSPWQLCEDNHPAKVCGDKI